MIPTVVLLGRANVGKSTLFNRLTKTRDALVADLPGLTRDRHYGRGRVGGKPFLVVDQHLEEMLGPNLLMVFTERQILRRLHEALRAIRVFLQIHNGPPPIGLAPKRHARSRCSCGSRL